MLNLRIVKMQQKTDNYLKTTKVLNKNYFTNSIQQLNILLFP